MAGICTWANLLIMNSSFGIDHPLIAVRDIVQIRDRLLSMGFNMTAIGKHPWGTSTSLAMFEGCLIEIIGIYDESLIDELPVGDFHFGRHIHDHLAQREGVALTALHSTNTQLDSLKAKQTAFAVAGHLEFGRDVTLPDRRQDRTKTTLVIMPDDRWPRLSFFLCQQHRPELVYVDEWLKHPNSVYGIRGMTILGELDSQNALVKKFSTLYGRAAVVEGGFQLESANGYIRILTCQCIESQFGSLPEAVLADRQPCVIGLDLNYSNGALIKQHLENSGINFTNREGTYSFERAQDMGNIFLRFYKREGRI